MADAPIDEGETVKKMELVEWWIVESGRGNTILIGNSNTIPPRVR
jgi:hypothetical protein